MSTENTEVVKEDAVYEATLIRGKSYTLRGARFDKDTPKKVAQSVKDYLEANAYEEVSNGLEGEDEEMDRKPKFKFSRVRSRA